MGICTLYNGELDKTIVESKTGNPIVLPPYKFITSLNISFSPRQAGTGDPSPENIRAISGWDKVQVIRCGKNLINAAEYYYKPKSWTYDGNAWVGLNPNYAFLVLRPIYLLSGNHTISLNVDTESNMARLLVSKNNGQVSTETIINTTMTPGDFKTTYSVREAGIYYVKFVDYSDIPGNVVTLSNIQIEVGSTSTPYEPHQDDTYDIALPETVYGGTVDAVTEGGIKSWGFIASYNGEALPGEWISDRDVYAPGTTPTTGAQVAYNLATPEPFKVNPISIPSLSGINTIYSDAGNLSCDFKISSFWSDAD